MDDKRLYAAILGLTEPWGVEMVELKLSEGEVHVRVALPPKTLWVCPDCLEHAPIHDHQERTWRHLDTCQYKTLIYARVPRLDCSNHGVKQIRVPWAEDRSRFTALFEALAIDWMKQAPISAVAEQLRVSWNEAAGIQRRAVERGLARRQLEPLTYVGVDETSFRRRHDYVSIVSDLERSRVLYVADDRTTESLDGFWKTLPPEQRASIEGVAMDMWEPFITSTRDHLPGADGKIVFDKFHIAQHLARAVDLVRRREHRELLAQGESALKGTKYLWLRNPESYSLSQWRSFRAFLRAVQLKTARAWALKEDFMNVWDYTYPGAAERHFRSWYQWARRSRLEPMREVAAMIRRHWDNIKTYFRHRITNAGSESINSKVQRVKAMARGFRNKERFRMAIYFHCGGLDLYPSRIPVSQ